MTAAVVQQKLELLFVLDALGYRLHPEALRKRKNRSADRRTVTVHADVPYERAIELQSVDRKAPEVVQARVTGAEVVDRQRETHAAQCFQRALSRPYVLHEAALGDLDLELRRIDAVFRD